MKYTDASMRMWSRLGPAGSLGAAAIELGEQFENVLFLTADMTFAAGLERFRNKYPDRIYNLGIAEQNLIGVSAGLASEGYNPFAVTYASFLATRALDQVKMNLGYMKQAVKLIGINAGFAAGILGPTHMAIEDIAAIRSIPNITIVSPADMTEVVKALFAAADYNDPMYIRLTGDMNQSQVYTENYDFQIGKAITLREGKDVAVISTGVVTANVIRAADLIQEHGINCKVINMHTIKPLDVKALSALDRYRIIVTVEEHNILGGLGSAVSEFFAEKKNKPLIYRMGVRDYYPHAGSYQSLLSENGLDTEGIKKAIIQKYEEIRK